jgi:hypothetical protein
VAVGRRSMRAPWEGLQCTVASAMVVWFVCLVTRARLCNGVFFSGILPNLHTFTRWPDELLFLGSGKATLKNGPLF